MKKITIICLIIFIIILLATVTILLSIQNNVEKEAPNIEIEIENWNKQEKIKLNEGEMDIILGIINNLRVSENEWDSLENYHITIKDLQHGDIKKYGFSFYLGSENNYITAQGVNIGILSSEQNEQISKIMTKYFN